MNQDKDKDAKHGEGKGDSKEGDKSESGKGESNTEINRESELDNFEEGTAEPNEDKSQLNFKENILQIS